MLQVFQKYSPWTMMRMHTAGQRTMEIAMCAHTAGIDITCHPIYSLISTK